jgi:aspartyl protease family protein
MATGFMPAIIALLLMVAAATAAAGDVALVGVIGDKAAVLALDGGDPKTVKVGQTWNGITVLSVNKGRAAIELDGRRRVLQQGQHYRSGAPASDRAQAVLAAGPGGHFMAEGLVNGSSVRFLVDTGATMVALPAHDAARMRIDYRKGQPGLMNTANGTAPVYKVTLDTVRLGDIELHSIDAVVFERGLDTALLGMTFLNRVEMKREGSMMTLTRRF